MRTLFYLGVAAGAISMLGLVAIPPGLHPIHIASCTVLSALYHPPGQDYETRTHGIAIDFVNDSHSTVHRVFFDVNYRGYRQRFVDVGKFAPHATISHTYYQFINLPWSGALPNYCRIARVTMSNGHTIYY